MNNKEILEKAISKAIEGGWEFPLSNDFLPLRVSEGFPSYVLHNDRQYEDYDEIAIEAIIYNHDFARALWGKGSSQPYTEGYYLRPDQVEQFTKFKPRWQYHLAQMVIDPDPIDYLGRNLND